ncbi:hypothetical protein F2Q68_00019123 [Brassica cretica]|uniref:Protein DA1-like domain-containing protein n=1 Tax=Brassica cretica TaxID=69181 RepID=A0A8S9FTZ1_BRACR|nr:hypothetical protein F2Q68_00019123 [Brassica cretica]
MGPNKQLIGLTTESQRVVSEFEVTAILILYGLPRLLTGYILAHEMMHAYLRLNGPTPRDCVFVLVTGYRNLNNVLEEGICQVLGHMWLESQTYATIDAAAASYSSSSQPPGGANASKKGEWSEFEKKLVEFCKNEIETDESAVYGEGFRKVNHMVTNSNLYETLQEILRRRGLSSCSGNKRSLLVRSVKCHKCKTFQVVKEGPKMGPNNKLTDMVTETQVVSGCPVTAILIIYGLPRLLTGYILAHEMMHAYLRLNGCNNLNNVLEEGICQVLGHMWLETQRYAPIDVAAASSSSNASKKGEWSEFEKKLVQSMVKGLGKLTIWCQITASRKPSKRFFPAGVEEEEDESAHLELEEGLCQVLGLRWLESHTFPSDDATAASSSSNTPPAAASTLKKGDDWSDFEKKLVEFCIHQIKEDDSPVYGLGFKQVHEIWVSNHYSLKDTLKDIVNASKNAPVSKF